MLVVRCSRHKSEPGRKSSRMDSPSVPDCEGRRPRERVSGAEEALERCVTSWPHVEQIITSEFPFPSGH